MTKVYTSFEYVHSVVIGCGKVETFVQSLGIGLKKSENERDIGVLKKDNTLRIQRSLRLHSIISPLSSFWNIFFNEQNHKVFLLQE